MGASIPHIFGCSFLLTKMLLAHDGGGTNEIFWKGDNNQVMILAEEKI